MPETSLADEMPESFHYIVSDTRTHPEAPYPSHTIPLTKKKKKVVRRYKTSDTRIIPFSKETNIDNIPCQLFHEEFHTTFSNNRCKKMYRQWYQNPPTVTITTSLPRSQTAIPNIHFQ